MAISRITAWARLSAQSSARERSSSARKRYRAARSFIVAMYSAPNGVLQYIQMSLTTANLIIFALWSSQAQGPKGLHACKCLQGIALHQFSQCPTNSCAEIQEDEIRRPIPGVSVAAGAAHTVLALRRTRCGLPEWRCGLPSSASMHIALRLRGNAGGKPG